ncbi:DUF115 domain-containing protein [Treponema sp. OMZ 840]|uniref:6-hydroxymethylpterin diphosphokinase MptE-like protein n=1 Tax=Treponema sp. OMZ 840 TaxID=244313 RepID=UPI003D8A2A38
MSGNDTPCTVEARQGVSVLYRGRYLFSRYEPQKPLQKTLETFTILPESLVLCLSPVLPFTVDLIREKIEKEAIPGCFILCAETDPVLYDFYIKQKQNSSPPNPPMQHSPVQKGGEKSISCPDAVCPDAAVLFKKEEEIARLLDGEDFSPRYSGSPLPAIGFFRRVLVLEASGTAALYADFYKALFSYAQNSIAVFWKNRMTLVRLGRLFSRNVLKNAARIAARSASSVPLIPASLNRPILVAGAGPSLDALIPFIKRYAQKLYIIAVDAAFRPLYDKGIRPNALVTVESQVISQRSLIGARRSGIPIIADMCARSANLRITEGSLSFFISEYAKLPLLERIKKALPELPVFPPLGSVGLAAVETALFLRAEGTSVFTCGLDFSYPAGVSHCKESPSQKEGHASSGRLMPAGNPASAFRDGAFFIEGKGGTHLACDPALHSYAELFSARYKNAANIYDLSLSGAKTGLPFLTEKEAGGLIEREAGRLPERAADCPAEIGAASVEAFYIEEKKRLYTLRAALTGESPLSTEALKALLEECSYLYIHFPDGHRGPSLSQSFLNRVRSEIDIFIKDTEGAASLASLDG